MRAPNPGAAPSGNVAVPRRRVPGRRSRLVFVGTFLVFVVLAAAFSMRRPLVLPADPLDPAASAMEPPPAPRSSVDPHSVEDGRLDILVVVDEQGLGAQSWPRLLKSTLVDRLQRRKPPLELEIRTIGQPGLDTVAGLAVLDAALDAASADLVLCALGWADGRASRPWSRPRAAEGPSPPWVAQVVGARLRPDRPAEGFYVHPAGTPRVAPEWHIRASRQLVRRADSGGALLVFVEQPVRGAADRAVLPSAAGRLVPWVSTVQALELGGEGPALFVPGDPLLLTKVGHERLAAFVAMGIVQFVP